MVFWCMQRRTVGIMRRVPHINWKDLRLLLDLRRSYVYAPRPYA